MIGISRLVAIGEALVLALPITLLFALGAPDVFSAPAVWYGPYWLVPKLVTLLSAAALLSGWYLLIRFIRGGRAALFTTSPWCWLPISLGVLVACVGAASAHASLKGSYNTPSALLRMMIMPFQLGLVLVIPIVHLGIESWWGWRSNNRWRVP